MTHQDKAAAVKVVPVDLLPCPFCGAANLMLLDFKVWCDDCHAYGPPAMDQGEAIFDAWNRRAAAPVVSGGGFSALQAQAPSVPTEGQDTAVPDVEQTLAGETVQGFKVAAWRYHGHFDNPAHGHRYCEHWSTPGAGAVGVERLFTETQFRHALIHQAATPDGSQLDADKARLRSWVRPLPAAPEGV